MPGAPIDVIELNSAARARFISGHRRRSVSADTRVYARYTARNRLHFIGGDYASLEMRTGHRDVRWNFSYRTRLHASALAVRASAAFYCPPRNPLNRTHQLSSFGSRTRTAFLFAREVTDSLLRGRVQEVQNRRKRSSSDILVSDRSFFRETFAE